MKKKLRVLEFFAGIGACSKALENLGIDVEIVDAVEIDKYAICSFNAIHNTNFEVQDITQWNKSIEELGGDIDLITHGSPCQDFSLAGNQKGGDKDSGTRSSLMYETIRIVESINPKYVLWENVKNLLSKKHRHNFDAYIETMDRLGYNSYYKVLNSKNYEIPQNRERVYTVSIRKDIDKGNFVFPEAKPLKLRLKDMLEDSVDEKYYLSDKMLKYISASGTQNFKLNDSKINLDVARPLTTDQSKRAGTTNYIGDNLEDNFDVGKILEGEPGCILSAKLNHTNYDKGNRVYSPSGLSPTVCARVQGDTAYIDEKDNIEETLNRADKVLKEIVETNQIKELPCCDSTINEPKVREVSNCITSRYNAGIQNQKQIGLCVIEEVEQVSLDDIVSKLEGGKEDE